MGFKEGFIFGVATAAYQIEGGANEDGRGPSIWDIFCKQPGKIYEGHTGDKGCDHYHRYEEDIELIKKMGVKAYRFSISWSRILPEGIGKVNEKGIEFYNRLIDGLVKAGIEPYITLFHWDLPYALHKKGGWMNEESPRWFRDYAKIVVECFSDRVKYFITFNEPQCFIGLGYSQGIHAPGLKQSLTDTVTMAHHVLLAHGYGVQVMRAYAKQSIQIGYAPTGSMNYPASEDSRDIEAARSSIFSIPEKIDEDWAWNVSWWSDPIFLGNYPKDGLKALERYMPSIKDKDMKIISEPIDFLGQNIYNGVEIRANKEGRFHYEPRYVGYPKTALNWPITPKSLYWGPKFLYERYKKPIYITENGIACHDIISLDGKVHDSNRIDFLQRYLRELKRAAEDEVDIAGYFGWSLMDNFEWHRGYAERFGFIYTDYVTGERILKDSAYWYKKVIETNGDEL